jgi:hypothetical protein
VSVDLSFRSISANKTGRLGFCAYPHTQQCFGHLGIGTNFLLYFSAWELLALNVNSKILPVWIRPEVLDAMFILPGGVGLASGFHASKLFNMQTLISIITVFGHVKSSYLQRLIDS